MKINPLKLVLLIVFSSFFLPGSAQVSNKEYMVKRLFAVLQQKDEQGFVNLFPDAKTMKEFLTLLFQQDTSFMSKELKDELLEKTEDEDLQKDFRKDFQRCMRKAETLGFAWEKTKFVSWTGDSTFHDDMKYTSLDGKIYFNEGTKEYFIRFTDIIWFTNKGWYGVSIDKVDLKSKENEADEFDEDMMHEIDDDSTRMFVDTSVVIADTMPPPKSMTTSEQKQSKPVKQPVNKTKTSTKSPARKQD